MRRIVAPLSAALCLSLLSGCPEAGSSGPASGPTGGRGPAFAVALVTPGSPSDGGWNALGYDGLKKVEAAGIPVSHVEQKDANKYEDELSRCARGAKLVFAHGYEYQDPCEKVSSKFPGVIFIVTAGSRTQGNVSAIKPSLDQCCYLAGIAAGFATKTKKLGAVGGMNAPVIRSGFDAFVKGAKRARPDIEAAPHVYLDTWEDISKGKEHALALIAAGCDVLIHNADQAGRGVFNAAKEKGVLAIGTNRNQNDLEPGTILASAVLDIPTAMLDIAQDVKAGTWKPHDTVLDMKTGYADLILNEKLKDRLPDEARTMIEQARKEIQEGKLSLDK
ncbi:BMP family protein [bacterium]|nr:BMP family protein [bacterium]